VSTKHSVLSVNTKGGKEPVNEYGT